MSASAVAPAQPQAATPTHACWHCGEKLDPAGTRYAEIAGARRAFCCPGCSAAAEWIDRLGLSAYYRLREQPATRAAEPSAAPSPWARPELARHVVRTREDGRSEVCVLVDGMRCSACVWLIERALGALPGVETVQVNAAARRARIEWDAARTPLPALLDTLTRAGYGARPLDAQALDDARREESHAAQKRLLVAGLGAMQAMMYAVALYIGAFDGMDAVTRDFFRWLGFLVATPVVLYAARPFFAGAWRSLRARRLGMDVPVALAIALVYAASLVEALRGGAEVYFDSVGMFVFFLLTGRYLEMRARHRAGDVTDALARLAPACADRVRADGALERVGAIELLSGDRVHVAEGASVPADGVLESDACRVDEALLTGESEPVAKRRGDALVAGSVVVEGPARVAVERVGADTVLAGIVALTARAQSERPRLAAAGERAAARFVARVLALTALTALGWSLFDPARAFAASLAVLVVSCPCAFALAVPAAVTRALAVLAQRGVLVVRPDAIEALAGATHVVFDKTGTLTDAAPTLQRIEPRAGLDTDAALALAAALARGSRHPVAQAIAGAAAGLPLRHANDIAARAGLGLEGVVDGRRLRLGRPDFALAGTAETCLDARTDAVALADVSGVLATLHFSERPRADAAAAVAALRAQGLELAILSGDAPAKVEALAATLGIARWHARQRPQDKLARLEALRRGGARVVMVGDGVNDAPVLAGADVAVSFGHGAELAQAHSDVVLGGEQLAALPAARRLAQQTLRVLQQNQRWAAAYNFAVVPVAALGFVPPWLAAIGMSASSLLVTLNALRIGRRDGDTHAGEAKA